MKDKLIGSLIGLARATFGNECLVTEQTNRALLDGLLAPENSDEATFSALIDCVESAKRGLIPLCYECAMPCGKNSAYDMGGYYGAEQDTRNAKADILRRIVMLAGQITAEDGERCRLICKRLFAVGENDWDAEQLLAVAEEVAQAAPNL